MGEWVDEKFKQATHPRRLKFLSYRMASQKMLYKLRMAIGDEKVASARSGK